MEVSSNIGGYSADEGEPDTGFLRGEKKRVLGKLSGKPEPWFERGRYTQMHFPKADNPYEAATGRGTAIITREAAERWGLELKNSKVVIQGFGNVGSYAGKFLHEYGCKIIGVSDVTGGLYDPDGLDIPSLFEYNYQNRTINGFKKGKKISNEELLALDCDFLIPAALGSAINDSNVHLINCKVIVEAANGPVTGEAANKLWDRKVPIIPDILTNAGGVTVSYFEWVQNLQQFKWTEDDVNKKLEEKMVHAFDEVFALKQQKKVPMRIASFMVAIDRV